MENIVQLAKNTSDASTMTGGQSARKVSCTSCCMRNLCIAAGTEDSFLPEIDKLVVHWHPMARGRHIFREGDEFKQPFVVRSGAVKTYQTLENGEEQITGFMLPGDVFGLEGLAALQHANGAIALETSSVCAIPLQNLFKINVEARVAERQVLMLLSESMLRKDSHAMMLAMNKAHERISAFLLDISDRLHRRGLAAHDFSLPMSRSDIGRFLGMSQETVSRAFAKLIRDKLIESNGRNIKLVNPGTLGKLSGYKLDSSFLKSA